MGKEFEAIRDDKLRIGLLGLKRLFEANAKKMTKDEIMAFDFTFMNITNALQELQDIKSAEPSEALKGLKVNEDIFDEIARDKNYKDEIIFKDDTAVEAFIYQCNNIVIEQTLLKAQALEQELEKYKKLEEQLGCPLAVLGKALKNGIYRYNPNYEPNFRKEEVLYLGKEKGRYYVNWLGCWLEYLDNYKKTWWLKEDKSE